MNQEESFRRNEEKKKMEREREQGKEKKEEKEEERTYSNILQYASLQGQKIKE